MKMFSRMSFPEKSASSISRPKGKSSSVTEQPLEKAVKEPPKSSSLTTSNLSTVETPNTSRPIASTIPSFSQNANVINVTINYGSAREED